MMRKEFVAICVKHNIKYDIDPKTMNFHGTISIEAPKGKVFAESGCHYHDYDVEENTMGRGYDAVYNDYISYGLIDCDDPECDCHNEPDRPAVVPEVPKPKTEKVIIIPKDTITFKYNDGGRKDAGYKGHTGDCVCRSIAIVTQNPYQEVYDALNQLSESERLGKRKKTKSNSRTGVYRTTYEKYLKSLGYRWIPTMQIGSGCKTHLRADELPAGRLVVRVSRHVTTMIDGVINDTWDCSRDGERCVYGYFIKKIED